MNKWEGNIHLTVNKWEQKGREILCQECYSVLRAFQKTDVWVLYLEPRRIFTIYIQGMQNSLCVIGKVHCSDLPCHVLTGFKIILWLSKQFCMFSTAHVIQHVHSHTNCWWIGKSGPPSIRWAFQLFCFGDHGRAAQHSQRTESGEYPLSYFNSFYCKFCTILIWS